ncbi:hypothetical protein BLL52_4257 [Rhodoferax antarcticus ANT.BR]|uniref:Uncharacterized protein n=1 Tax=Rhodoferax antarcticus ANT.BR TaxID=1111071 RepID=A0A1Q8Y975_9BURK|nr:hypothetical protein BLL52_4257 [Rhodoferax antarcticus ANT.BR]
MNLTKKMQPRRPFIEVLDHQGLPFTRPARTIGELSAPEAA